MAETKHHHHCCHGHHSNNNRSNDIIKTQPPTLQQQQYLKLRLYSYIRRQMCLAPSVLDMATTHWTMMSSTRECSTLASTLKFAHIQVMPRHLSSETSKTIRLPGRVKIFLWIHYCSDVVWNLLLLFVNFLFFLTKIAFGNKLSRSECLIKSRRRNKLKQYFHINKTVILHK